LSPLRPIPTRKNADGGKQRGSPTKSLSLASQQLIHESVDALALGAGPSRNDGKSATVSPETTQLASNKGEARQSPSSDEDALRDVLDEVGERRRKEKEDIIKQWDIRRKSLGAEPTVTLRHKLLANHTQRADGFHLPLRPLCIPGTSLKPKMQLRLRLPTILPEELPLYREHRHSHHHTALLERSHHRHLPSNRKMRP